MIYICNQSGCNNLVDESEVIINYEEQWAMCPKCYEAYSKETSQ
jgi:hypothetical protein